MNSRSNAATATKPKGSLTVIVKDRDSRASKQLMSKHVKSTPTSLNTSSKRKPRGRSTKPVTSTPGSTERNTSFRNLSLNTSAAKGPEKKRGRNTTVETAKPNLNKVKIEIDIPEELKQWQLDEYNAIKRQQKLLDIPAKKSAKDIIDAYVQWKKSRESNTAKKEAIIDDVAAGLITYFDCFLGANLLYIWERPQHAEILQEYPDTPLAQIYGSFHLLRLLRSLGPTLSMCLGPSDEKRAQKLQAHLEDFVKYLVQDRAALFSMQHFVDDSPEYHRKAQQIEIS